MAGQVNIAHAYLNKIYILYIIYIVIYIYIHIGNCIKCLYTHRATKNVSIQIRFSLQILIFGLILGSGLGQEHFNPKVYVCVPGWNQ